MRCAFRPCLVFAFSVACSSTPNGGGAGGAAGAFAQGGVGNSAGQGSIGGSTGSIAGSGGVGGGIAGVSGQGGRAAAGANSGGSTSFGGAGDSSFGGAGGSSFGGAGGSSFGGAGGLTSFGGAGGNAGSAGTAGGGAAALPGYFIGADITWVQAAEADGETYSDGTPRDIFQILKDHGFNYIRLRTFVDPKAADGYDQVNGFADLAHTIAFGKRIKAAGLGFLLDFHYSDNWADPGKQCVPIAWQSYTTIEQLANAVHDYTKDAITQLIAGGARPDMVQVGNEITPGMLLQVCDSTGTPTGPNQVTGSTSNWSNLGALLNAGVKGVKDVDSNIKIMLHIDRGGDKGGYTGDALTVSKTFITNAQAQGVQFDVFGESCYQAYQGDPNSTTNTKTDWTSTFGGLASAFPKLQFVAAEYGPMQREINDVVFGLPNMRGLGTFNWEPTKQGDWNTGHALFSYSNKVNTATADLSLYDAMKTAYASRL